MNEATEQPTRTGEVWRQAEVLRGLVDRLEPDAVPVPEVAQLWDLFGRIGRLATAGQLLLARRVQEAPEWKQSGCRSAAEYMARKSGRSVRAERDALKTSKRLVACAGVASAVRNGELSEQRTGLITDAASADPGKEDELVELAGRLSLMELAQECGRIKATSDPDPEATYRRIRENRRLRQRTDGEGAWCLSGRSTADDGALVNHALAPLIDKQYAQARTEGRREHRDAYAWDALIELIRRYLDVDGVDDLDVAAALDDTDEVDDTDDLDGTDEADIGTSPADPPPERNDSDATDNSVAPGSDGGRAASTSTRSRRRRAKPKDKRKRSRPQPRHLALLRVDLEALIRGHIDDGELCEIGGAPVPVTVARKLLGDSILQLVITKGVDVASVTHLGRGPTAAQRVALLWQRPQCSNEACGHGHVEIDHRVDWATTRRTVLGALDPLCGFCHGLKTHHGWALVDGTGRRSFVAPDDPRHPKHTRRRSQAA